MVLKRDLISLNRKVVIETKKLWASKAHHSFGHTHFFNPFPAMTGGFNPGESEAYKNIFNI